MPIGSANIQFEAADEAVNLIGKPAAGDPLHNEFDTIRAAW
jgi:hypothetical protein